MTKEEFINKIETYQKVAGNLIEGDGGYNIKRGMAHSISGYAEDLFALYIAKNVDDNNLQFCVDKVTSIRFLTGQRAKSFKPDLSIINNEVFTHYFDIKTNMGWNRNFEDYLKEKNDFVERLKGNSAWITWEDSKQVIQIAENLQYQMVIISGSNINQKLLQANLKMAKNYPNVKVHVLIKKKEGTNSFELNEAAFDEILNSVMK